MKALPRAAVVCAAVGFINALVWALLIPPFHVPDEASHFAYSQHLVETGELQKPFAGPGYSEELDTGLFWVGFGDVAGRPQDKPPLTDVQEQVLDDALADDLDRGNASGSTPASNNPPLYYAAEAVPYLIGSGSGLLERLYLMRILSALMAGLTVLFVYLFLRELLPGLPWAWAAGALAVAFQPLFGFIGGGVNSDNLLYLASAGTFYALARAFRRGLTVQNGALLGGFVAAGLLTKLTFVGLVPGVLLALVVLVLRGWRARRSEVLRAAAVTVALAAVPFLAYVVVNDVVWERSLRAEGVGQVVSSVTPGDDADTAQPRPKLLREQMSYFWQLYLPRAPFQNDQFEDYFPLYETWVKGFVAHFGYLDYGFPPWAYTLAAVLLSCLLLAAVAAVIQLRARFRARLPEFAVYAAAMLGLLFLIALGGYEARLGNDPFPFEQARYLLPLLPLYGAIVALALRAAGRRIGQPLAVLIVALAAAHSLWAMFATLERYYL